MPTPDKTRPWLHIYCTAAGCEFTTRAEFEGLRHQDETGHSMDWTNGREFPKPDAFRETRRGRGEVS